MPMSMFGRFLTQEWKDKFVKHVVEYCPQICDDEDLQIHVDKKDIPRGLKSDNVTAELNLFTTHKDGHRKSKYAFKSILLSLDIFVKHQGGSNWVDGMKLEMEAAKSDIRNFIFDQKPFKVGSDGVLTIFSCMSQNALVIVFEKHFAFFHVVAGESKPAAISTAHDRVFFSCVDVQLVSLLQGSDKVSAFLEEVKVKKHEELGVETQDFTLPETSEKLKHLMMSHHPRLGIESGLKNIPDHLIRDMLRKYILNNQKPSGEQVREYLISLSPAYHPVPPVYEGAKFCLLCMKKIPVVGFQNSLSVK